MDMDRIQTAATRGILFIDSKYLRTSLVPIPTRAIEDIKSLIVVSAAEKTQVLLDLFRGSTHSLSNEPASLEE